MSIDISLLITTPVSEAVRRQKEIRSVNPLWLVKVCWWEEIGTIIEIEVFLLEKRFVSFEFGFSNV